MIWGVWNRDYLRLGGRDLAEEHFETFVEAMAYVTEVIEDGQGTEFEVGRGKMLKSGDGVIPLGGEWSGMISIDARDFKGNDED